MPNTGIGSWGLKYEMRFEGEEWTNITNFVDSRQTKITEIGCTEELHGGISSCQIQLRYGVDKAKPLEEHSLIVGKLLIAKENSQLVKFRMTGAEEFTGKVDLGNFSQLNSRIPGFVSVDCEDNSYLLDETMESFEYPENNNLDDEGYPVFDKANLSISIVVLRLIEAGYLLSDIDVEASDNIPQPIKRIAHSGDDDRTYRDFLDVLLFDHCAVLYSRGDGKFVVKKLYVTSPVAERVITENLVGGGQGITTSAGDYQFDGENVVWSTLSILEDANIYNSSLPLTRDDEGRLKGEAIQPSHYWPKDGDIEETWQEYEASFLDRSYQTALSRVKNKDLSIISAKNIEYQIDRDPEIILANNPPEIEPRRARFLFYNSHATEERFIRAFTLVGDVLFRSKLNDSTYPPNAKRVNEPYTSEFIFNQTDAQRLVNHLYRFKKYGDMKHRWAEISANGKMFEIVNVAPADTHISTLTMVVSQTKTFVAPYKVKREFGSIGITSFASEPPRTRSVAIGRLAVEPGQDGEPGTTVIVQYALGTADAPYHYETSIVGTDEGLVGTDLALVGADNSDIWSANVPVPEDGEYVWRREGYYSPPAVWPDVWNITRLTGDKGDDYTGIELVHNPLNMVITERGYIRTPEIIISARLRNLYGTVKWTASDGTIERVDPTDDTRIKLYTSTVTGDSTTVTASVGEVPAVGGLIAWYPFNGDVDDYAGNFNATSTNVAMVEGPSAKLGYSFNGSNSKIAAPNIGIDAKAFALWVYVDTLPTGNEIILTHGPSKIGLGFYNNGYLITASCGGTQPKVAVISNFNAGAWNHIAVSYVPGGAEVFINGVETSYLSTVNCWTAGGTDLAIGFRDTSSPGYFKGGMADLRIYNAPLSALDVATIIDEVDISMGGYSSSVEIAKLYVGDKKPINFGLVESVGDIPDTTEDGQPLVKGDYFLWGGTTNPSLGLDKGEIYVYDGSSFQPADEDEDGDLVMTLLNSYAELEDDDENVVAFKVIKKLVSINAFIKNLVAENLQAGPGKGTAGSGFRFRAKSDRDGDGTNVPVFDVMYDDKKLLEADVVNGVLDFRGSMFVGDGTNDTFKAVVRDIGSLSKGDVEIGDYSAGKGVYYEASTGELKGKFSQIRNVMPFNFIDSLDSAHPFEIDFYIPPETVAIVSIVLNAKGIAYRAYSASAKYIDWGGTTVWGVSTESAQANVSLSFDMIPRETGSAGGHSHSYDKATGVSDGGHSHSLNVPVMDNATTGSVQAGGDWHSHSYKVPSQTGGGFGTDGAHSHSLSAQSGTTGSADAHKHTLPSGAVGVSDSGHTHQVKLDFSHGHDIVMGIIEGTAPKDAKLYCDNGSGYGTAISLSASPNLASELNLTTHFSGSGWKRLKFTSSQLGRIVASLIVKVDITT